MRRHRYSKLQKTPAICEASSLEAVTTGFFVMQTDPARKQMPKRVACEHALTHTHRQPLLPTYLAADKLCIYTGTYLCILLEHQVHLERHIHSLTDCCTGLLALRSEL